MKFIMQFKFTIAALILIGILFLVEGCTSKEESHGTAIPNYKPQHKTGDCLAPNLDVRHNYTADSYYKLLDVQGSEYLQSAWAGNTWSTPVWYIAQYMDANFQLEKCPDAK